MTEQQVRYEDVTQLRSRISWGAVVAGMVIALATYMIITLLFAAIGLSLTDAGVRGNTVGIAAIIAAVVAIVASMFIGGWITTQLTAGETHREAVIHGVLCWAAVTGATLCMAMSGMRAGYFALVGGTMVAQTADTRTWDDAARQAGVPQARIDQWKQELSANNIQVRAADPQNQEQVRQAAMVAAWSALAGTLLSLGAAVGGALAGSGPSYRLFPLVARERREIIVAR